MALCVGAAFCAIWFALAVYAAYVCAFAARLAGSAERACVFAVIPDAAHIDAANFTWEPLNSSLIYAPLGARPPPDGGPVDFGEVCRDALIAPKAADAVGAGAATRERLRLVVGTRNCAAYLWIAHARFVAAAAALYALFCVTRSWRRMFGVARFKRDLVSPSRYAGSYAARVISTTLLGARYAKMASFMCELSIVRGGVTRAFVADPISFLCGNVLAAALIAFELGLRLAAQCCAAAVATTLAVPCAAAYSTTFKALSALFVATVALAELALLFAPGPADRAVMLGEAGPPPGSARQDRGGPAAPAALCTACCSTVLSGIFIKLLHLAFVVAVVFSLVKYEQRVQAALFGGAI